jgi:hypothetical protein
MINGDGAHQRIWSLILAPPGGKSLCHAVLQVGRSVTRVDAEANRAVAEKLTILLTGRAERSDDRSPGLVAAGCTAFSRKTMVQFGGM